MVKKCQKCMELYTQSLISFKMSCICFQLVICCIVSESNWFSFKPSDKKKRGKKRGQTHQKYICLKEKKKHTVSKFPLSSESCVKSLAHHAPFAATFVLCVGSRTQSFRMIIETKRCPLTCVRCVAKQWPLTNTRLNLDIHLIFNQK